MQKSSDREICPICSTSMIELKGGRCLLMCPNCGARIDCSDVV
ncbi:MAG: hypothetical protein RMJ59_01280 [Candidatus Nitrosocaldus sp.]|nr:hypothetical protein [Candidatus Nitrosocaldus sp.]MDW8274997.1 hypothetical protein [Candidatus Nitrosocaldus sp.]